MSVYEPFRRYSKTPDKPCSKCKRRVRRAGLSWCAVCIAEQKAEKKAAQAALRTGEKTSE